MSRPLQGSTAQQQSLWTERTKLTGIGNGSPMVQAIADSLQMIRPIPDHRPEDFSAAFEYVSQLTLPQYMIPLPDHYAARIRDAFDGDRPDDTSGRLTPSIQRLLDDAELSASICSRYLVMATCSAGFLTVSPAVSNPGIPSLQPSISWCLRPCTSSA
jgi:hypothetical protein